MKSPKLFLTITPLDPPMTSNFSFTSPEYSVLSNLGTFSEQYFSTDSASCLIKLRAYGEFMVKEIYALHGIEMYSTDSVLDLLDANEFRQRVAPVVLDKFHLLRIKGNSDKHEAEYKACKEELHELEILFASLQQRAFKGEL